MILPGSLGFKGRVYNSGYVRQNLVFDSGFEGTTTPDRFASGGYLEGYDDEANQFCCSDSIVKSTAQSRSGSASAKFLVRTSDATVSGSKRAEVVPNAYGGDSGTMWYGFSMYLLDWVADESDEHIWQWHPASSSGSAVVAIWTSYGEFRIAHGDPLGSQSFTNVGTPTSNVWIDWVFNIKWATDTSGFVKVWKDGVQVLNHTGIRTSWSGGQYLKVGINKFDWVNGNFGEATQREFYIDSVRVGNSFATYNDVAP